MDARNIQFTSRMNSIALGLLFQSSNAKGALSSLKVRLLI